MGEFYLNKARILIVEDEAVVAENLEKVITDCGYEVVGRAASADDAVNAAIELKPDLILMDIVLLGEKNGIDASYEIKEKIDIPIIFLTAYSNLELIDKAKSVEPYAYIVKPFQDRQLFASIETALYRIQMAKKLKESEERYHRMVANIPGMVYQFVLHPNGSMAFPFVSESCHELFGIGHRELMRDANVLLDIIHPDDQIGFYRSVADSAKSLSPWKWEGRGVVSGAERWFRCISRPERQADGDILWDGLVIEVTERKGAEKRIEEEYHRAEFYIDLMSHDINNINQVTRGYLELLLKMPDLPSKSRKYTETALDHVRKSADIISNVKTLSTVRLGELEIEKIDIYPVFASAVETVKSQSRDIRINSNITEGRYFIRGNALLFNVFSNLLNNAAKFDGRDIVEIDVDISSQGDGWRLEFKDRGPGIGEDYKNIIFNRLEQAGESTQGSGLGLTIVKYIVESYGGKVWVEDRVEGDRTQGSNFIVMLLKGG
ncbi:MAG: response regulator [ANME-2 cluster archaeon]|jgi:PAS domain S-box-containing protein|nr:MAG: response regulator [ANME-2 cluster archaeon]